MILQISKDDAENLRVDRSGVSNNWDREGLELHFGDFSIEFDDEEDALDMCRAICKRLGEDIIRPKAPMPDVEKVNEDLRGMIRRLADHFGVTLPKEPDA